MAERVKLELAIELEDKASKGLKSVGVAATRLGDDMDAAQRRSANFTKVLAGVGVAGAAAVAGLATAAISAAAGFEQGLSNIEAVSGATAAEMERISGLALQLGKDTSFSASAASAGIEELIKGGVEIADVMGGAAQSTLNLAAAGGVELAEAAEIAANAMSMFSLEGKDMAMVSDQIAGAANASSLSVTDYKFSLAAAGSVMASSSQTIESTTSAIALMAAAGIKGSDSGTSLKAAFNSLIPTTEKAGAMFRELGIITEDGTNQFINANGTFKQTGEIAAVLQKSLSGLSDSQRSLALETMFGADGMRAGIVLAKAGAEGFDEMAASIGKVTAASVASDRLDNLRGDLEQLKGSLETAGIVGGTVLLPMLRDLAKGATGVVNAAIPLIETWGPKLVDGFGDVADIIEDTAIPALKGITIAGGVYALTTLPSLTTALVANTRALLTQGAALTASLGPYVLLAGAVAVAVKSQNDYLTDAVRKYESQTPAIEASTSALDAYRAMLVKTGQVEAGLDDAQVGKVFSERATAITADIELLRQKHGELVREVEQASHPAGAGSRPQFGINLETVAAQRAEIGLLQQEIDTLSGKLVGLTKEEEQQALTGLYLQASYAASAEAASAFGSQAAFVEGQVATAAKATKEAVDAALKGLSETVMSIPSAMADATGSITAFNATVTENATAHWANLETLHAAWAKGTTDVERTAIQERIDAENAGYAKLQNAATVAYAIEQAALRQHLGEELILRANHWATVNGISAERLSEFTGKLAAEWGIVKSASQITFEAMTGHVDAWANDSSISADTTIGKMRETEIKAAELLAAEEKLSGEYVAKFVDDFDNGTINAQELATKISQIPTLVKSRIEHNFLEAGQAASGVKHAVDSIPTSKTVSITANVDRYVEQKSPAPVEDVMAAIDEFTGREHVFNFVVAGLEHAITPEGMLKLAAATDVAKVAVAGLGQEHAVTADGMAKLAAASDVTKVAVVGLGLEHGVTREGMEKLAAASTIAKTAVDELGKAHGITAEGVLKLQRAALDTSLAVQTTGEASRITAEGVLKLQRAVLDTDLAMKTTGETTRVTAEGVLKLQRAVLATDEAIRATIWPGYIEQVGKVKSTVDSLKIAQDKLAVAVKTGADVLTTAGWPNYTAQLGVAKMATDDAKRAQDALAVALKTGEDVIVTTAWPGYVAQLGKAKGATEALGASINVALPTAINQALPTATAQGERLGRSLADGVDQTLPPMLGDAVTNALNVALPTAVNAVLPLAMNQGALIGEALATGVNQAIGTGLNMAVGTDTITIKPLFDLAALGETGGNALLDSIAATFNQGGAASLLDTVIQAFSPQAARAGADSGSQFIEGIGRQLELQQPDLIGDMITTFNAVSVQAIVPWLNINEEKFGASGRIMVGELAGGIEANASSAIAAASSLGNAMADALLAGYGNPVLPAPTIAGGVSSGGSSGGGNPFTPITGGGITSSAARDADIQRRMR